MFLKRVNIILILAVVLASCARIVMPPGGEADKLAPKPKKTMPENRSANFDSDKIVIDFDEYVVLKNFNQEFVSSPLFNEKPEKILRGKSLVLKFDKDSLMPNTTYTLDFGNSIVDFRAGNILPNYQYVFSTGDIIDSLSISGHVFWAEDLSPQEQIWVLLYKNYTDSTLSTTKPDFVAKTDVEGYFSINNIAAGTYGMAALKDINSNFIFDLPNEQIAFLDTVFELKICDEDHAHHHAHHHGDHHDHMAADSLLNDSLSFDIDTLAIEQDTNLVVADSLPIGSDSLLLDSLKQDSVVHYHTTPDHIDLFLFEEDFQNIYLQESQRPNPYLLQFIFSQRTDSVVDFRFKDIEDANIIVEPNEKRDTFNVWLIDTVLSKDDTLNLYLGYLRTDTTANLVWAWDTLVLKNKVKKEIRKRKKDQDTLPEPKQYLDITTNAKASIPFDFYKRVKIKSPFPIKSIDTSKIQLYELIDSSEVALKFNVQKDSIKPRDFLLDYVLEPEKAYRVMIEPEAYTDYRALSNDTLDIEFKTKPESDYTEIILNVSGLDSNQVIIELMDSKGKIVKKEIIRSDVQISFPYLKPGNYILKAILDANENGKWDTGDYRLKRQAESVYFYPEELPTKANWSHDVHWILDLGHQPNVHTHTH